MARTPVPIPPPPEPSQAERRATHNLHASRFARGVGRWRSAAPQSPPPDRAVRPRAPESVVTAITDRPLTADDLRDGWPAADARLTPAVAAALLNFVRAGAHPTTAARLAAVPASRFRSWTRRIDEPYATLARLIDLAEAVAELHGLRLVVASADPMLALAFLARRFPRRWGRRDRKTAEMLRAVQQAADAGQQSAGRDLSPAQARMQRVRPWLRRRDVMAKQARRPAERSEGSR